MLAHLELNNGGYWQPVVLLLGSEGIQAGLRQTPLTLLSHLSSDCMLHSEMR